MNIIIDWKSHCHGIRWNYILVSWIWCKNYWVWSSNCWDMVDLWFIVKFEPANTALTMKESMDITNNTARKLRWVLLSLHECVFSIAFCGWLWIDMIGIDIKIYMLVCVLSVFIIEKILILMSLYFQPYWACIFTKACKNNWACISSVSVHLYIWTIRSFV